MDGISYVGAGVNNSGKCGVKIESVAAHDFGQWICTLVSDNGTISRGELSLADGTLIQMLRDASVF